MIKIKSQIATQDKFAKYKKNILKQKATLAQNIQNKYTKTMMSVGNVIRLESYWKDKYENFLGVKLPSVKIHKTNNSIIKSQKYNAHSYAQGINIYFGKDTPNYESTEGQALLGHELTHILQQKYLDISSNEQIIDPSILLERKAGIVEDRIRYKKGIEESSGGYFKRWDVLPQRSYIDRKQDVKFIKEQSLKSPEV
jgi:uncharacterized protein YjaZ